MNVKFWGVRGSVPSPLLNSQIQAKIDKVLSVISAEDLKTPSAKKDFLKSLPPWVYGTIGGNTPCVQLTSSDNSVFFLDMGSGARSYSIWGKKPKNNHYYIFQSHFHWDHIQGLPFFSPVFDGLSKIDFYSANPESKDIIAFQHKSPYFPPDASWNHIKERFNFHTMKEGQVFEIGKVKIKLRKMNHPGDSYAYSFEENGKKLIYATDVELRDEDFIENESTNDFFKDADVLILDSQYSEEDALTVKKDWGHTSYNKAIDFASFWKVKKLYLFHHDPFYDDEKIFSLYEKALLYAKEKGLCNMEIKLAIEGQEFDL